MKHLLNNLSEEERNTIREQHVGGMKVEIKNFKKLVETKQGEVSEYFFDSEEDGVKFDRKETPSNSEQDMVHDFKYEIKEKLTSGGSDWSMDNKNPNVKDLIAGIRRVCDKYEAFLESEL